MKIQIKPIKLGIGLYIEIDYSMLENETAEQVISRLRKYLPNSHFLLVEDK